MRYLLLLLTLFTLTGCCNWSWDFWNTKPTVVSLKKKIDSQAAVNLVIDFSKTLEDKYHLFLEDSSFWYDNEIEYIQLDYSTQAILTVKDAREILVEIVENLMVELDEDPVLADKLKYPFKAKRLQIYLDCQSFYGRYIDPFYISWIILEEGTAYFYAFDLQNHGYDFWHSRIEPYFKSLQIVRAENASQEKRNMMMPTQSNTIPEQYRGTTAPPRVTEGILPRANLYPDATILIPPPVPGQPGQKPATGPFPK